MTTFTEDFTGTAGVLSTGYTAVASGAISRNGSGAGTGTNEEERGVLRTNETYGNDQKVTWTRKVVDGPAQGGVLRGSGSGSTWSGYRITVASVNNWEISRITSGAATSLNSGSYGTDFQANDVFEVSVTGTVITLKVNTNTVGTYDTNPDGTKYSSGSPGFYAYSLPTFDDVIFEDTGGGGTPSSRLSLLGVG